MESSTAEFADPEGTSAVRTERTYGILDPKDLVGVPQNPSQPPFETERVDCAVGRLGHFCAPVSGGTLE